MLLIKTTKITTFMQWFSYNQRALELSELTSQNRYVTS
jgi:hypothetical protein